MNEPIHYRIDASEKRQPTHPASLVNASRHLVNASASLVNTLCRLVNALGRLVNAFSRVIGSGVQKASISHPISRHGKIIDAIYRSHGVFQLYMGFVCSPSLLTKIRPNQRFPTATRRFLASTQRILAFTQRFCHVSQRT